jgi:RNA polymerase sigma-70 factor (ECF subfamily)
MRLPVWKRKTMVSESVLETRGAICETSHREAFLRLMAEYGPALTRLTSAYAEQKTDREDLFQEIAVAIWQALPKFRGESTERTWLYRIAHNVAISSMAKIRRRGQVEEEMPERFDRASSASNAEQEALRAEKLHLLRESIRNLSVIDREIILLHLEGLGYIEIEEVSGLSESAIATRLTRIREKLKQEVERKETGSV